MSDPESEILSGKLLEDDSEVSFAQLCEACEVHAESVEAMIEEGIIAPPTLRQAPLGPGKPQSAA